MEKKDDFCVSKEVQEANAAYDAAYSALVDAADALKAAEQDLDTAGEILRKAQKEHG